ncbi:tetratricopeptide repeat protein [Stigmatella hybrida]|uniref:hypothetical protein n=1 Tax=Stigmatella hybrida TaxID=394097 RepID=UPI001CDADCE1|nr:hypothetical protein [Stigmatella hybrida]
MSSASSRNADALLRQADETEEAGDINGAEALLTEALARKPDFERAWYQRGLLRLFEREAPAEALADLCAAEELGVARQGSIPPSRLHYAIGECLFGLGRFAEADARLHRGLSGETDAVMLAELHYRRAECADKLGRTDALREALTRFLSHEAAFLEAGGEADQLEWARTRFAGLSHAR